VANFSGLFTAGFLSINLQFAMLAAIAALFFAFSGYLQQLGITPATTGFIISADALAALIIQPLISPLIHVGTARRWLLGGSLLLSAALFMLAHVASVPLLVTARLAQGAGFICVLSSLTTMMIRFIPPGMSGRAFGWLSMVRMIPYAMIPLLFDLFAITPSAFGGLLIVAALTALVPVVVLLFPFSRPAGGDDNSRPPGLTGLSASLRSPAVVLLLLSALLFFCGYSAIFFFLKQFGLDLGIANTSLFFTVATLVMIAVRLCGGWLFDRCNKALLCAFGLLLAAVCYALLPFCASSRMFFVLAGFIGLGWGVLMPLQAAVMFDISPPSVRAMNQNLLLVMMQVGFFIGPFIGGQLISRSGYTALFVSVAAITLVAGLLLPGIKPLAAER